MKHKAQRYLTLLLSILGILIGCFLGLNLTSGTVHADNTDTVNMYRLYNPNSGEHFYTGNDKERSHLVSVGWKDEGLGWVAPSTSAHPVYRLYNPNAGDHHYTLSSEERQMLIRAGWKDEGTGWFSADQANGRPVYRQYNPNAIAGAHNFTTSKEENDFLVKAGWKAEGIAWYAVNTDAFSQDGTSFVNAQYVPGTVSDELKDTTYQISAVGSSYRVVLPSGDGAKKIQAGKPFILPSSANCPDGATLIADQITTLPNGSIQVTSHAPSDASEVLQKLSFYDVVDSGSGDEQIVGASNSVTVSNLKPFEKNFGDKDNIQKGLTLTGQIRLEVTQITVGGDIDFTTPRNSEIQVLLQDNGSLNVNLKAEKNSGGAVEIGRTQIQFPAVPGLSLDLIIRYTYSVEGQINITYSFAATQGLTFRNQNFNVTNTFDPRMDLAITAKGSCGLQLGAGLSYGLPRVLGIEAASVNLAEFDVEAGPAFEGSVEAHTKPTMICVDVNPYLYAKWAVNGDCYLKQGMDFLKIKTSGNIWTLANSPLKWSGHYEDGSRVDACTYEKRKAELENPEQSGDADGRFGTGNWKQDYLLEIEAMENYFNGGSKYDGCGYCLIDNGAGKVPSVFAVHLEMNYYLNYFTYTSDGKMDYPINDLNVLSAMKDQYSASFVSYEEIRNQIQNY